MTDQLLKTVDLASISFTIASSSMPAILGAAAVAEEG
jgi:hypothetical protein